MFYQESENAQQTITALTSAQGQRLAVLKYAGPAVGRAPVVWQARLIGVQNFTLLDIRAGIVIEGTGGVAARKLASVNLMSAGNFISMGAALILDLNPGDELGLYLNCSSSGFIALADRGFSLMVL